MSFTHKKTMPKSCENYDKTYHFKMNHENMMKCTKCTERGAKIIGRRGSWVRRKKKGLRPRYIRMFQKELYDCVLGVS